MNYLKLKTKYPESVSRYLNWVSINHFSNAKIIESDFGGDYKDINYFKTYFGEIFKISIYNYYSFHVIIDNPRYVSLLMEAFPTNYSKTNNTLSFYVSKQEDFDNLFKCTELLNL